MLYYRGMSDNDPTDARLSKIEAQLKAVRADQKAILMQLSLLNQHMIASDAARGHERATRDHRWDILSEVLGINAAIDEADFDDDEAEDEADIPPHIRKLLRGERGG